MTIAPDIAVTITPVAEMIPAKWAAVSFAAARVMTNDDNEMIDLSRVREQNV